jgi:hypothetical protein
MREPVLCKLVPDRWRHKGLFCDMCVMRVYVCVYMRIYALLFRGQIIGAIKDFAVICNVFVLICVIYAYICIFVQRPDSWRHKGLFSVSSVASCSLVL